MKLFRRKKKESLSELQGVPDGTFRCDVCRFVQPSICLCGTVIDAVDALPPKTYTLCGSCALWLDFEEPRFPQGLCINFSEKQREKIKSLHKELDITNNEIPMITITSAITGSLEDVHKYLEQVSNLGELVRVRISLLPQNIIDLSGKLTRGEFVEPSEIKKANKG